MFKTTKQHKKHWANRKIDWDKSYLNGVDEVSGKPMWNHPHRTLIMQVLSMFHWVSLWEVGVGAGANLVKITKTFQGKQLGGSDINADAIELCRKVFVGGRFHVESTEDMLLSDNSVDVILSDASLIYIGPTKINKTLKEMARIARNRLVLCEFHSTSLLERLWLRYKNGYNAYDYRKELEKIGCYDIQMLKIPKEFWQGFPWEKYGYIITCKIAK